MMSICSLLTRALDLCSYTKFLLVASSEADETAWQLKRIRTPIMKKGFLETKCTKRKMMDVNLLAVLTSAIKSFSSFFTLFGCKTGKGLGKVVILRLIPILLLGLGKGRLFGIPGMGMAGDLGMTFPKCLYFH